jgi:hypothetical protein
MNYDKGSPILIESQCKRKIPFGTTELFDPITIKITVTDPGGTVKVNAANMTKSDTAKYYYVCQTATNWTAGYYTVKVESNYSDYTDVTINTKAFKLI